MDKEKLKQRYLNMIEEHRDEIIALGKETYKTPELDFKGSRTGKLIEETFCKLELEPETGVSYTDCRVSSDPKGNGLRVVVMGELDCIMCDSHPDAAEGEMAHVCGYSIQLANMYGAAIGILTSSVMEYLESAADFITIPTEKYVDYEYRSRLMSQGTVHYLGGRQELMYRGGLDDTDMVLQCHMMEMEPGRCCIPDTKGNGFISKTMYFPRKVTHAGLVPEQGINALNVAELAMNNIHTLRETFRGEDKVWVNIVIKKGGGLVNVVPGRVTMEIMVRAFTIDTMEDTSHKVNRNMKIAAMALGGKVEIHDCIGYLPLNTNHQIARLYRDNVMACKHAGEDAFAEGWETAGSTDLGDISQIIPCMHIWAGGMKDGPHTENYRMDDPYAAYIAPAKMMALTITNLL